MKHLPKHLRPKWRYLGVGIETWPDADLDRGAFQRHLWYAAQNLLGDPGSADADLRVFGFRHEDGAGEAVVRTRRDTVGDARAALACISEVDGDPIGVHVRGVSGTVRACEEKYLGGRPEVVGEQRVVYDNAERAAVFRDGVFDVRTGDAYTGATELDVTIP